MIKQKNISLFLLVSIIFFLFGCSYPYTDGWVETSYESQFHDVTYANCVYILNKRSHIFQYKECYTVNQMKLKNMVYCNDTRESVVEHGYRACQKCNP